MKFVLDCSVSMSWCFEDETNDYSEKILNLLQEDNQAKVPPLWRLEIINVLLIAQRKGRVQAHIAHNFKNALNMLPIYVDNSATDRVFDTTYELANTLQLTAYDASYLELAVREKLPLATLDQDLMKVAKKIKVDLLQLNQ